MNDAIRHDIPVSTLPRQSVQHGFDPYALRLLDTPREEDQPVAWVIAIAALYALSFVAPTTWSGGHGEGFGLFCSGLWLLVVSVVSPVIGLFYIPLLLCWLANPIFWVGLSALAGPDRASQHHAGTLGLLGTVLALIWLLLSPPVFGQYDLIGPAYYLWLGSFMLLAVAGLSRGEEKLVRLRSCLPSRPC